MSWMKQGPRESPGLSVRSSLGQCRFRFSHVAGGLNIGKMVTAHWLHGRMVQHRDNSGCSSSLCHKATQLSLSLYFCGTSQAAIHSQSSGAFLGAKECVCKPFKRRPGFSAVFCLTLMDGIPTAFQSHMWGQKLGALD